MYLNTGPQNLHYILFEVGMLINHTTAIYTDNEQKKICLLGFTSNRNMSFYIIFL